eukprot:TRINITY_DN28049_c0_g1_i2.p2 TRINITY_DN28049_c0_g1~~TRINITY_DN28049_c0_g1_i2.p2  ORF type:complete len:137 (-),score=34.19 TRINITY_DN28049_c0_g1_i2:84-494(-)
MPTTSVWHRQTPNPTPSWNWPAPASYSSESTNSSGASPVLVVFLVLLGIAIVGGFLRKLGLCDRSRGGYRPLEQKNQEPLRPAQVFQPNYYQFPPSAPPPPPPPPPPRYGEENSPPELQSIIIPGEQPLYHIPPPS